MAGRIKFALVAGGIAGCARGRPQVPGRGGLFTDGLIEAYVRYERDAEVDAIRMRPHLRVRAAAQTVAAGRDRRGRGPPPSWRAVSRGLLEPAVLRRAGFLAGRGSRGVVVRRLTSLSAWMGAGSLVAIATQAAARSISVCLSAC